MTVTLNDDDRQNTHGVANENAEADTASGGAPEPRDHSDEEHSPGAAPPGGDAITHEQLEADNEVEEDTVKTLDPDNAP